jgi:hypothetical protein
LTNKLTTPAAIRAGRVLAKTSAKIDPEVLMPAVLS